MNKIIINGKEIDTTGWSPDEIELAECRDDIKRLRTLLLEAQPYVCLLLDKAENYGKARVLNDKINAALHGESIDDK